jgi:hypothetical protein
LQSTLSVSGTATVRFGTGTGAGHITVTEPAAGTTSGNLTKGTGHCTGSLSSSC